ncbi:MAG: XrtA/PEP-CTERM system histidine kinase PrsK [Pseudomonadales bacterium]|nr:PEP-CTERM system histidine kinase PrsK [Gammaproteobacteria bacterium]
MNNSTILFGAGAAGYLFAALAFYRYRHKILDAISGVACVTGLAIWQATLAWDSVQAIPQGALILVELFRAVVIIYCLQHIMKTVVGSGITRAAMSTTLALAIAMPLAIALGYPALIAFPSPDYLTIQRAWVGIFVALGLLIAIEQVFRNTDTSLAVLRYACIGLGVTAVYDLYLYADTLIFERLDLDQWSARGGINALVSFFVAFAVGRSRPNQLISVSRNVVFYTTSLTAAGLFLLTISAVGYAIRKYGGTWGTVFELMLFFGAIMLVAITALSQRARDQLRVYISKNFFALRYDYRKEWLHLIAQLSGRDSQEHLYVRAIRVLADLYKSPGGLIWLAQEESFVPTATFRVRLPDDCRESIDSPFCKRLAQEWIFEIGVRSHRALDLPPLPSWIPNVADIAVVVPLLDEEALIGFVGLQRSLGFTKLTWEDLDIMKAAAREVASNVARYQSAEQLASARQFDTYHQLTAFIMHDLKNLIAQQELVVKNAAKHKENPAFVEDAIETIQNSVARMSSLLGKLQQKEPAERRPVALQDVLIEVMRKCESLKPKPALRIDDRELRVLSDRDHLIMVMSHLIKNAQEATRDDGFVDVILSRQGEFALLEIEDNGSGMDPDFLRNRLFRPFESTKAGKGMGIGAYQAREFIHNIGGDIKVQSTPGTGTTFRITIPLADTIATDTAEQGFSRR